MECDAATLNAGTSTVALSRGQALLGNTGCEGPNSLHIHRRSNYTVVPVQAANGHSSSAQSRRTHLKTWQWPPGLFGGGQPGRTAVPGSYQSRVLTEALPISGSISHFKFSSRTRCLQLQAWPWPVCWRFKGPASRFYRGPRRG